LQIRLRCFFFFLFLFFFYFAFCFGLGRKKYKGKLQQLLVVVPLWQSEELIFQSSVGKSVAKHRKYA